MQDHDDDPELAARKARKRANRDALAALRGRGDRIRLAWAAIAMLHDLLP